MARLPRHPGEVLANFLYCCEVSQNALARRIRVPPRRVNAIVLGKRAVTAETALLLAEAFHTSPLFWMRLQADYDLALARAKVAKRPALPTWESIVGENYPADGVVEIEWGERVRVELESDHGGACHG